MGDGHVPKPRQIKAWSDLTGMAALLKAQDRISVGKQTKLHLDLRHVYKVDAIGLAIFLARLAQLQSSAPDFDATVTKPESERANRKLNELGMEARLAELGFEDARHRDLFDIEGPQVNSAHPSTSVDCASTFEVVVTIVPRTGKSRTELLSDAKQKIKKFLQADESRNFAHEQLMIVLLEMIKNTLDHSGRPAVLGLRLQKHSHRRGSLSFSYCDTGDGIGRTVRRHIQALLAPDEIKEISPTETDRVQTLRLVRKGGLSDILHWALLPGNSTKFGNGINLGLGLMLIVEGARNCGIRLLLKDADSVWTLTEISAPYSHAEIRRLATNTCADPLLMYHGEMEYDHEM